MTNTNITIPTGHAVAPETTARPTNRLAVVAAVTAATVAGLVGFAVLSDGDEVTPTVATVEAPAPAPATPAPSSATRMSADAAERWAQAEQQRVDEEGCIRFPGGPTAC